MLKTMKKKIKMLNRRESFLMNIILTMNKRGALLVMDGHMKKDSIIQMNLMKKKKSMTKMQSMPKVNAR
jgi:hypothetical protein